jgi:prepilin-type N-terminal cleavage/methylation domain-containing protein
MSSGRGFTLLELLVVIVIFGFLMAMGSPAFSTWQRKHNAEAEIERLYSNLQFARMKAYTEKITWGVWWGTGNNPFSSYEIRRDNSSPANGSINDSVDANVESAASLKFPIASSGNIGSITFDSRGFCNVLTTLYVADATGASNDCLKISSTRIKVGKWDGSNCNPK